MADDDKALVLELRGCDREIYLPILGKAADRIEALSKENDRLNANLAVEAKFVDKLSAENERLREALGWFLNDSRFVVQVGGNPNVVPQMIEAARAALGETK